MSEQKTAEAQEREAFEDAVFNAYFFKSIKRNPNPPRGTGAMDFIATATKTQVELCERDGESYKDEAVSAMWFGWGLATRALSTKPDRPMLSDARIDAIAFATEHRTEWLDDPEIWRRAFAKAIIRADREGQS